MGERCKVAARPETSLFGNDGVDASVEALQYQLQGLDTDSRETARKRVCPDQHDRPHRGCVEWIPNAHCMAENDILLKQRGVIRAYYLVLKGPESGSDAVGDLASI